MKKKNIALLYGGKSGEHEVSLRSGASIGLNLDLNKYDLTLIGINKQGFWFLQPPLDKDKVQQTKKLEVREENKLSIFPGEGIYLGEDKLPIDFVFPIVHGTFGEDGRLQGLLEMAGLPYAGAGVLGSAIGMDKDRVKAVWTEATLPVVPYLAFYQYQSADSKAKAVKDWGFPLFIKPTCAGSSVGVSRADTEKELDQAVAKAFQFDRKIMIEPCVNAREIECSVLGNELPEVFVPGEIVPTGHSFYDYEAKYIDPDGATLLIPAPLTETQTIEVKQLALKAYKTAQCRGFARVDFFLDKETETFQLNEINTLPGFTEISMYSMLAKASGVEYSDLLNRIIEAGIAVYNEEKNLIYSL
ncbi:D-alanine--D-alanine ligase family protein [Spirochaeta cellobiosiphila]|uniref:D-alanine--D-alanine ligase family protein n=1 Tax=Spirochaeta cellobiosiphila TaxID=504483 RepID=UPI000421FDBF|nr:D-alanine--D-alanine ligase family protein [Spirochaeta cellobiosiphila]